MNKKYRCFKNTLKCCLKRAEKVAPNKKILKDWYCIILKHRYDIKHV